MKPSFIQLCAATLSLFGSLFFLSFCLFFLSGCAAPGPKYLNLSYSTAHPVKDRQQSAGLSRFNDKRSDTTKGHIGYRQLWGDRQEIYAVTGQDLSAAMTRVFRTFLEQRGFSVVLLPPWPATAEGVSRMPQEFAHVFAADINRFACRAVKTGVTTEMTLIIDVTFHQGTPDKGRLSTIPVVLTLERTELVFSRKKLETFINDALEEIFVKAFPSL
ncbi:MAG: hypothetical protein R6V15_02505 [Desulfotignum sp.]